MTQQTIEPLFELELLKKASNGDEKAFRQLYQRYKTGIYNYILRLIHDESAAEELLQDVFLAVWQGAGKFRNQSSVKTWIFRIAHFQAVSWLRKNLKVKQIQENENGFEWKTTVPSPEETIIERREMERVLAALDRLSPNHRSVIQLTFVYGFSNREIAEIMKCPVGTVKSRMSFALKYLLAILDNDHV